MVHQHVAHLDANSMKGALRGPGETRARSARAGENQQRARVSPMPALAPHHSPLLADRRAAPDPAPPGVWVRIDRGSPGWTSQ